MKKHFMIAAALAFAVVGFAGSSDATLPQVPTTTDEVAEGTGDGGKGAANFTTDAARRFHKGR